MLAGLGLVLKVLLAMGACISRVLLNLRIAYLGNCFMDLFQKIYLSFIGVIIQNALIQGIYF